MTLERGAKPFPGNKQLLNAARNVYDASVKTIHIETAMERGDIGLFRGSPAISRRFAPETQCNLHMEFLGKTHIDQKDWTVTIDIYNNALEAFPTSSPLKQNLKYCQSQENR